MLKDENEQTKRDKIGIPKIGKSLRWFVLNLVLEKKCFFKNGQLVWELGNYNLDINDFPDSLPKLFDVFGINETEFNSLGEARNDKFILKLENEIITLQILNNIKNHDLFIIQSQKLESALKNNRLLLFHQPIISSKDLSIIRYECLARIKDEDNNLIMPNDFIPAAEYTGKIRDLDISSLKLAIKNIKNNNNLSLAINISGGTLNDNNARQEIENIIASSNFGDNYLTIELTETIAIENIDIISNFANILKKNNARIALDDFGSGYTSFKTFLNVPFDEVKIDGYYIDKIAEQSEKRDFVAAIDRLSNTLGIETIAEKVETEAEAKTLKEIGINGLQGYYYGKPKLPE